MGTGSGLGVTCGLRGEEKVSLSWWETGSWTVNWKEPGPDMPVPHADPLRARGSRLSHVHYPVPLTSAELSYLSKTRVHAFSFSETPSMLSPHCLTSCHRHPSPSARVSCHSLTRFLWTSSSVGFGTDPPLAIPLPHQVCVCLGGCFRCGTLLGVIAIFPSFDPLL